MGYYSTLEVSQEKQFSKKFEKIFNEITKKYDNETLNLSPEAEKIHAKFLNLVENYFKDVNFKNDLCYLSNYTIKNGWIEPADEDWTAKHYAGYLLPFLVYIAAKETNEPIHTNISFKFTGEDGEIWGYTVDFKHGKIIENEYELTPITTNEYDLLK